MSKKTKLIHFTIADGTPDEIKALTIAVKGVENKLPFDIKFIVTDNRVEMHSVKYLITELYKLYKQPKETKK